MKTIQTAQKTTKFLAFLSTLITFTTTYHLSLVNSLQKSCIEPSFDTLFTNPILKKHYPIITDFETLPNGTQFATVSIFQFPAASIENLDSVGSDSNASTASKVKLENNEDAVGKVMVITERGNVVHHFFVFDIEKDYQDGRPFRRDYDLFPKGSRLRSRFVIPEGAEKVTAIAFSQEFLATRGPDYIVSDEMDVAEIKKIYKGKLNVLNAKESLKKHVPVALFDKGSEIKLGENVKGEILVLGGEYKDLGSVESADSESVVLHPMTSEHFIEKFYLEDELGRVVFYKEKKGSDKKEVKAKVDFVLLGEEGYSNAKTNDLGGNTVLNLDSIETVKPFEACNLHGWFEGPRVIIPRGNKESETCLA